MPLSPAKSRHEGNWLHFNTRSGGTPPLRPRNHHRVHRQSELQASCFSERHRRTGRKSDVCRTHLNGGARRHVRGRACDRHSENDQPCLRGDGGHRRERPRTSRPGPDSGIPGAGGRVGGRKTPL